MKKELIDKIKNQELSNDKVNAIFDSFVAYKEENEKILNSVTGILKDTQERLEFIYNSLDFLEKLTDAHSSSLKNIANSMDSITELNDILIQRIDVIENRFDN